MSKAVFLTTNDNPYDPVDEFNKWYMFDSMAGYNSCGYLSRIAKTSDALSDQENLEEIERAIDEIVSLHSLIYKKIVREIKDNFS